MTNEQIQHRKYHCESLRYPAYLHHSIWHSKRICGNRNNELRNNVSSISNFEQQDADLHGNTHIFNNQKNK